MTLNLTVPQQMHTDFTPKITVIGVGGGGTNAVDNMIASNLQGVEFVVANTDAQQLMHSRADRRVQLGPHLTQGLGAGAKPEIGRAAAEEAADELVRHMDGTHMVFITAGMGGGTGTGAAPVIARMARERGILTVGVVTKPFTFEGARRAKAADAGISAAVAVLKKGTICGAAVPAETIPGSDGGARYEVTVACNAAGAWPPTAWPPPTATRRGRACSAWFIRSMPVATTETRTRPDKVSSIAEPKMMLASSATSSRMRFAAWSTSNSVMSSPPVMLISSPRAPLIEVSSSSGLEIAASAARMARLSPSASPVPIMALPISAITVRMSAKSRFTRPGAIIRSVTPRTPM